MLQGFSLYISMKLRFKSILNGNEMVVRVTRRCINLGSYTNISLFSVYTRDWFQEPQGCPNLQLALRNPHMKFWLSIYLRGLHPSNTVFSNVHWLKKNKKICSSEPMQFKSVLLNSELYFEKQSRILSFWLLFQCSIYFEISHIKNNLGLCLSEDLKVWETYFQVYWEYIT